MKQILFIFLLAIFTILSVGRAAADDIDWKKGKWEHLAQFIGTYKHEEVLNDPAVQAEIKMLLTPKEQEKLERNFSSFSPIGFESDCLVLSGNAPHAGNTDRAFMNVCLYNGDVHVVITENDEIKIFTRKSKYRYLPESLRAWVYYIRNPEALTRPAGVEIVNPK